MLTPDPWSYTPEEKEHSLREGLEVVVSVDVCAVHHGNLSEHLKQKNGSHEFNCNHIPTQREHLVTNLHANDGVDEEQQGYQKSNIWQRLQAKERKNSRLMCDFTISLSCQLDNCTTPHLKWFDESPKQGANALPFAEELDQPHDSKQTKEGDGDASTVLRVLRRNSLESEDQTALQWTQSGTKRSELRRRCQIHMGWGSSTASYGQKCV